MKIRRLGGSVLSILLLALAGQVSCTSSSNDRKAPATEESQAVPPDEDLAGRAEAWKAQRAAPGTTIPEGGRRDAMKHKGLMETAGQEDVRPQKEYDEDLAGRASWWSEQRTYPAKKLPKKARLKALGLKVKMQAEFALPETKGLLRNLPVRGVCNWVTTGPRNINGRIRSLAVHPTQGNVIYAGAAEGGIWRSTNSGQSWYPLMQYEESIAVGALAVDPSNPNTLYAGTGEPTWWPGYEGAGVLKSTDGGATWSATGAVANEHIARLVIDPTNTNVVYCAGFEDGGTGGLFKTTNGGATWTRIHAGDVTDMVLNPSAPNTLYDGIRNDGVYQSLDGGATWAKLGGGLPAMASQRVMLSLCAAAPNTVYAKLDQTVYRTTDGGTTWTNLGSHGGNTYGYWCNYVAVDPTDANIVFAAGVTVEKSSDGGSTWVASAGSGDAEKTRLHADQHALVFEPSNHLGIYAANDGGVYHSTDGGATWKKVSDGLIVTQFYDVGLSSLVRTMHGGGVQDQGTNATTGGLTWNKLYGADGGFLVMHPSDGYTMVGETQYNNLIRTSNGGSTWSSAVSGLTGSGPWVGALVMDETSPTTLFTGRQKVFRSTDGGANWSASSDAVGGSVSALAIAPSNHLIIYAGTSTGKIWRSTDGGATVTGWSDLTEAPLPGRYLSDIAVNRTDANTVVLTFSGFESSTPAAPGHVFRTTDGGATWSDISGASGAPTSLPDIPATAVALDPFSANRIYVGTDIGIFKSSAGGGSWTIFEPGLPNVAVTDLAVDDVSGLLFAATHGRGIWQINIRPRTVCSRADVYVRDNLLDTGQAIPSPSGITDPLSVVRGGVLGEKAYWWMSPDIKVDAVPYYTPDALFDGVEFDRDLVHDNPVRLRGNKLYVQIANRGPFPAKEVKVKALYAATSAGLPLLPPDFWTRYPGDSADTTKWHPIGAYKTIKILEAARPVVLEWDWRPPKTAAASSCILVVTDTPDDPIPAANKVFNVAALVRNEKRATLKNVHVISVRFPFPMFKAEIYFHNPFPDPEDFDIVFDRDLFPREGRIDLVFPQLRTSAALGQSLEGLERLEYKATGMPDAVKLRVLAARDRVLKRIRIEPKVPVRAEIEMTLPAGVKPGSLFFFTVLQRRGEEIVGGNTFEIRVEK